MNKIIAVTQARFGSTRLPGKILLPVDGKTLLDVHLQRIKKSKLLDALVVATTNEPESNQIVQIADKNGALVYKGSTEDVLSRFYKACENEAPDYVVRITSDCPLIDPDLIDECINTILLHRVDYVSNSLLPTFPDGLDVEVFTFAALQRAYIEASTKSDREHVTSYIRRNSDQNAGSIFRALNVFCEEKNVSSFRITVDEENDYLLIKRMIEKLGALESWKNYIDLLQHDTELAKMNKGIPRNEGYMKSIVKENQAIITNFAKSDIYRAKIHNLIPGGAHTYSKGDDQFPSRVPAAIEKGKGAYVWDIDGNKFLDCSMGLGSVSLGHAYEPVLDRVKYELDRGVNFQRPSVIEMEMAEAFLAIVAQHDMIKFAKNGSTVTTAAVKLARAYTGRALVAFPAEHPFYSYDDWFIGKTACDRGVPKEISDLSVTYNADNLESLKSLFKKYPGQIACVISEPEKNFGLPENYLQEAISEVQANGALYILDEMVTGLKTAFPGSMTKHNVVPDMATWGKGIANGFSFCALTGKREVMDLGGIRDTGNEKVFLISTTHGGETHAIAACLATLETFQKYNVIEHNHSIGELLIQLVQDRIKKAGLGDYIQVVNCKWMPLFIFKDKTGQVNNGMRTLVLQEMIKRGVLFQGVFIPCFSHTVEDAHFFAQALEESLPTYAAALNEDFEKYLIGSPTQPVFRKFI